MKEVYIDALNHCHPTDDGTMTAFEHPFFDGMCDTFIEGYCAELDGNGNVYKIYPWKPYSELDAAQRDYERQKLAIYEEALKTMGVEV